MRKWVGLLAGMACCVLLHGPARAAVDDDWQVRPPRTGVLFGQLVDQKYQALRAKGTLSGKKRRLLIEAENLEAADLEAKGFDDPVDEALNRALIRHAADLGDRDSHNVLLALQRFWHVPCRQHSPSGC